MHEPEIEQAPGYAVEARRVDENLRTKSEDHFGLIVRFPEWPRLRRVEDLPEALLRIREPDSEIVVLRVVAIRIVGAEIDNARLRPQLEPELQWIQIGRIASRAGVGRRVRLCIAMAGVVQGDVVAIVLRNLIAGFRRVGVVAPALGEQSGGPHFLSRSRGVDVPRDAVVTLEPLRMVLLAMTRAQVLRTGQRSNQQTGEQPCRI